MHDPVGLHSLGGFAFVEDQGFLDAHYYFLLSSSRGVRFRCDTYRLVGARRFPVACSRRSVRPRPVRVLAVPRAEEIPLPLAE